MHQTPSAIGTSAPPGPPGRMVLGSLLEFLREPLGFLTHAGSYGDLVHFRLGPHSAYLVKSPEYLHEVFVKQVERISRHLLSRKAARKFVGDSLALIEGEQHRRDRKLIMQAFHPRRMEGYATIMIDETQRMLQRWQGQTEVGVDHEMQDLALRIACRTLFGVEVSRKTDQIIAAMADFQRVLSIEAHNVIPLPDWLPIPHKIRMRKTIATLHEFVLSIIREKKQSKKDGGDLISTLLAAVDEETGRGLTEQQVHDHIIFLFVAGHETTSNLLAWVPYLLERNPEENAVLMQEIDRTLGDRTLAWTDLSRFVYLEQVVKETLRLYPSAWLLGRSVVADLSLGPYTVRRGSSLFMSPFITQRDARSFAEPTRFRPERFAAGAERSIPRFAYFPFGSGITSCIGAQFALMSAKIALGAILQRYQLRSVCNDEVPPGGFITLRPGREMRMRLHARVTAPVS